MGMLQSCLKMSTPCETPKRIRAQVQKRAKLVLQGRYGRSASNTNFTNIVLPLHEIFICHFGHESADRPEFPLSSGSGGSKKVHGLNIIFFFLIVGERNVGNDDPVSFHYISTIEHAQKAAEH